MCGIFGYVGDCRDAAVAVMEGLRRLDYRGYDSWGIAVLTEAGIEVEKQIGAVSAVPPQLSGSIGIGHTRWATHGAVTEKNAHPHYASDKSFVLAHNGIVENADELKNGLTQKGYSFETETDTEAIVRLIEKTRKRSKSLSMAVRTAFKKLEGRNTIIVLARTGEIIAARNGSPLVVGMSAAGEMYFSSDILSFAPHVTQILVMENGEMLTKHGGDIQLQRIHSGERLRPTFESNAIVGTDVSKGAFKHYMLKEIHDTPHVIQQQLRIEDSKINKLVHAIHRAKNVYTIGSGTAGAAAAQTAFYLRRVGGIRALSLIGAEATEYYPLFGKGDLIIAPSQSGETADVLEVLEHARKKGARVASHVNMPGSEMTRISDFPFMAEAGPEICVMSTKIFTAQIAWGYLVSKAVAGKLAQGRRHLRSLVRAVDTFLSDAKNTERIKNLAQEFTRTEHLFLLGKGQNAHVIKEGMVKIIEGAYIHAHGIPAGDLKHYAITLIEKGTPVIAVVSNDALKQDVLNAVHEVRARGARVVGIAPEESAHFDTWLPVPDTGETNAIMNTIPLQLIAYYLADSRGNSIDKPRNIAKSVTVK